MSVYIDIRMYRHMYIYAYIHTNVAHVYNYISTRICLYISAICIHTLRPQSGLSPTWRTKRDSRRLDQSKTGSESQAGPRCHQGSADSGVLPSL